MCERLASQLENLVFPPLSFYMSHIHRLHEFADAYVRTCISYVIDDMSDGAHLYISIDGGGDVASSSCDVSESHMSAALAVFSTHEDCPYFHGFFRARSKHLASLPIVELRSHGCRDHGPNISDVVHHI